MSLSRFACLTDTGRVRKQNEDAYACVPEKGLWVIADGMGGHEAGELASAIVTSHVLQQIQSGATPSEALESAHQTILDAAGRGEGSPRMGCTAALLQLTVPAYLISWVGDCRAYLFDGRLRRLTRDHALVQQLLEHGAITREEARVHPERNVVTRALGGGGKSFKPETVSGVLSPQQTIILCSDGLTHELEDADIELILARNPSEEEAARELIRAANEQGGADNITVIVVSAPGKDRASISPSLRSAWKDGLP